MRPFRPFHNLRRHIVWRIMLTLFAITSLIIGVTNFVLFGRAESALTSHLTEQGQQVTRFLAHTSRLGTYSESAAELEVPTTAAMGQNDVIAVAVFNENGKLLIQKRRPAGDDSSTRYAPPDFSTLPAATVVNHTQPSQEESDTTFTFWAPVMADVTPLTEQGLYFEVDPPPRPQRIGTVAVTLSRQKVEQEDQDIFYGSLFGGLALLLISSIIFYFVLHFFTKPLTRLIQEIRPPSQPTGNKDDLSMLSDTYSTMVEELGRSFETINAMKADLEIKVAERTAELTEAKQKLEERQEVLASANRKLEDALGHLRSTQLQLVQSEKMVALGQVVAGVAHEVNNTVNFISGALPAMRHRLASLAEQLNATMGERGRHRADFAEIKTLIENMESGIDRTVGIVRDLQAFARKDDTGTRQHYSVHDGLDSTLALLLPQYENRIEIIREYHPALPAISCYAGQVNQVFMNILVNATQAIRGKGRIRITTMPGDDGTVSITIGDSGPGIPKDVMPKIFDPFFTTKAVGQGTGLGLSISYQIVARHQGRLLAENSAVDGGARFEVILPLVAPEPAPDPFAVDARQEPLAPGEKH